MPSSNALDDNPIYETSRRLPLRNASRKLSCSPSPQRPYDINNSNEALSIETDEEQTSPLLMHRWHHKFSILSTVVFPGLGLLFCGTQDHQILVFDMNTYERKTVLTGHTGSVLCLTRSQDEKYLFSGGSDSLVKVWDVSTFKETHTIYSLVDIGDIFSIAWSPSSNTIFFGCQNAAILSVHLLDTIPKNDPSSLPSHRFDKFFDSTGPTGISSSSTSKKEFNIQSRLIEVPSSNIIRYAHYGFIYSMKLYDNNQLITGGGDGSIKIWDISKPELKLVKELQNEDSVLSLDIVDSFLYCGLTNGQLKLWDLSTYQQILLFQSDSDEDGDEDVLALAATQHCLFKGSNGGVTKWKFGTNIKQFWNAHEGLVLSAEIVQRDNKVLLITGGNDASVAIWDITTDNAPVLRRTSVAAIDNDTLIATLGELVSFKTVSKKPELHIDESRRCANYLKNLFKHFGADSQLIPVENGNPIVYASFKGKERSDSRNPRILWYGHYDVIDAGDQADWKSDPYKLNANDGFLQGRGVSDNKGPVLAAIYSVAELLQEGRLTSDIVFLIEGEEECGSFGFQDTVMNNKGLIGDIDWVLLSNSYWLDESTPCLNYGLRGVLSASVKVTSDNPDRHSGVDGGVSREPTIDLIRLLSKLTDDYGKVQIPKFYEPIQALSTDEEKLYDAILNNVNINISKETLLAKWKYPSLTVHKIDVSGPGNSTVIPKSCIGSISIRIVPEQNLEDIKRELISYLTTSFQKFKSDNHLDIKIIHESEPWLGDPSNAAFEILKENVIKEWGVEPLYIREGGSIPSVRFLEKVFNAPAAQIPCGQSTDNAHLNNEKLRVTNLYTLRKILKRTFSQLPIGG